MLEETMRMRDILVHRVKHIRVLYSLLLLLGVISEMPILTIPTLILGPSWFPGSSDLLLVIVTCLDCLIINFIQAISRSWFGHFVGVSFFSDEGCVCLCKCRIEAQNSNMLAQRATWARLIFLAGKGGLGELVEILAVQQLHRCAECLCGGDTSSSAAAAGAERYTYCN